MKSVSVDGVVKFLGESIITGHGTTVLVDAAEVEHTFVIKNLRRRKTLSVSYTVRRKRIRLKLKPGQSVDVQIPVLTDYGVEVKVGEDLFVCLYPDTVS